MNLNTVIPTDSKKTPENDVQVGMKCKSTEKGSTGR